MTGNARAEDSWWPNLDFAYRWEMRAGVFAHGLRGKESNTVDLQGSIVTPRLGVAGEYLWHFLKPRLEMGGFKNLSHRTSAVYADVLWTTPITERLFTEIAVGPSLHDGSMRSTATMAGLGCSVLVHAKLAVGYRITDNWSVLAAYTHMSNAKSLSGCPQNQGLDNLGVQISHAF
jgi:hypothetical protein